MDKTTSLFITGPECSEMTLGALVDGLQPDNHHLAVMVIDSIESLPMIAAASPPYGPISFPDQWQDEYKEGAKAVQDAVERIETFLQSSHVEGDVSSAFCEMSLLEEQVTDHANFADFVLLPSDAELEKPPMNAVLHTLLFDGPAGVMLNAPTMVKALHPKRPFIAWDRSLPAARAVHRALPVLKQADEVTVAVFDPVARAHGYVTDPGADLAAWLSRHGCNVTVQQYPSGGGELADAILSKSKETASDLIVMGAYTRSRLRQLIFGGTTQKMITTSELPLLLAH